MKIGQTYSGGQRNQEIRDPRSQMDINDFIQIMVAEIQNIDPMGGSDGGSKTDYISQMAQFTTLEQLTDISKGLEMLTLMGQQQYSFNLIGKEVEVYNGKYDSKGQAETIRGLVEKVRFKQGYISLVVEGEEYYLGDLVEVGMEKEKPDPETGGDLDPDQDKSKEQE